MRHPTVKGAPGPIHYGTRHEPKPEVALIFHDYRLVKAYRSLTEQ